METIKLLLVDDELEFREATSRALERRGFQVTAAESGARALERIGEAAPDIVVLDLRMPGMDGIETLRRIRDEHGQLPVLILTGHGGFDDALSGVRLDVVDFLQKPLEVSELAARVREILSRDAPRPLRERGVRELMVPATAYAQVYDYQPVREVVQVMRDALAPRAAGTLTEDGRRTVMVVDKHQRFIGALRVNDLLRAVVPGFLAHSPYASYFTGMFLAQCKVFGTQQVRDLLRDTTTIDVEAPLMEAVHLMASTGQINLPVVEEGQLVGVLRDKDLVLEIAAMVGATHR